MAQDTFMRTIKSEPRTRLGGELHVGAIALMIDAALFFGLSALPGIHAVAAETALRFNRDVRPILAENCLACHGPDMGARKAGLRLDTKDGIFERTPKREPAVVPGSLEKSPLWQRITATDPDDVMPPPKTHKVLTAEERERLKQWILAGAPWQGHWAFLKPERPPVPSVAMPGFEVRNPIDAFVAAKLQSKGLKPALEAERRALARRLALDLTGLPPKPEDLNSFLQDRSADAYEKLVRKLMASPHWGEHRARYWLDAARYADTHGLHFDNYREIWPYRDWVIQAFNRNLPFDRFTLEQIAGDLLENPTDDQIVATGFHRSNMTTNEGGTIEEENLANYANDRVTTTSWVWLGLTMNCCACHDHKFDPVTTRDFYSMAAFFRNTSQSGFDRNWRESDLHIVAPQTESDRARWKALPAEIDAGRKALATQQRAADSAFTNWLGSFQPEGLAKEIELRGEYLRLRLAEGEGTNATGQVNGIAVKFTGPTQLQWRADGPLGPAPILTKDNNFLLGDVADLDGKQPFSVGAWIRLPEDFKGEASIVARMGGEEEKFRGWDLWVKDQEFGLNLVHRLGNAGLTIRSTEKALKRGEWQHLLVTYDGSGRAAGAKLYLNGTELNANRDRNSLEGSIHSPFPLRLGRRERSHQLDGVAVQDIRIHRQSLSSTEVQALAAAPRLAALFAQHSQPENTNARPRAALLDYFRFTQHAGWREAQSKLAALEFEQQRIRGRSPVTLVQREKKESEPMAQILFRGQYDKPKDKVSAATPATLHTMPPDAPKNRLGLGQWLISSENPLTARVTVNRFWQEVFGVGLVKTTEDFGVMGESPLHPELLDWLAVEFQASGWNVQHLFELIVTSSIYRQSAQATPEKLARDPQNRWLSRGPRFRMDGEMVRDYALAAGGLLSEKVGGPSVKPYQPDGVWEAVAMPESNTHYYTRDQGEALYRRSLYTFWKRAAPPPLMDTFNAPSREVCTVRRERTNTPLQALATLNDPQFVEAARHVAELALARTLSRPDHALDDIALRLLARALTAEERTIVKRSLDDMLTFYEERPEEAKSLLAAGESKPPAHLPVAQLAALTMVANQLLNLDEVLNK